MELSLGLQRIDVVKLGVRGFRVPGLPMHVSSTGMSKAGYPSSYN